MKVIMNEVSTYNGAVHELVELREILKTEYVDKGKKQADVDWIGKQITRVLNGLEAAETLANENIEIQPKDSEHVYGW